MADPHEKPERGRLMSIAKALYYTVDYVLGYAVRTWPQLVRSTLVVYDRYYEDLLVDGRRYRYGGPEWVLRWLRPLIPKPDLVFLLDASAEVLHQRKQEVPLPEVRRQRQAYLELVSSMPNGHVIDASQPLDRVVVDVEDAIISHLSARTAERLGPTRS